MHNRTSAGHQLAIAAQLKTEIHGMSKIERQLSHRHLLEVGD
jgi:hypothetical protein